MRDRVQSRLVLRVPNLITKCRRRRRDKVVGWNLATHVTIDAELIPNVREIIRNTIVVGRDLEEVQRLVTAGVASVVRSGIDKEIVGAPCVVARILTHPGTARVEMCVNDDASNTNCRRQNLAPIPSFENVPLETISLLEQHRSAMHHAMHHVTKRFCTLSNKDVKMIRHYDAAQHDHSGDFCGACDLLFDALFEIIREERFLAVDACGNVGGAAGRVASKCF